MFHITKSLNTYNFLSTHLGRLYILVFINNRYVIERLPEGDILVLIVELLFIVVRRAEPFPRESVNEQRMFLEVLLQGVLLGDNSRVIVVIQVNIIVL